ncbi:MAG: winged helix-turn-helix transcriptional regulator [candidate division WOR-3 bacterium]|nr:MAG: winged helix-turn-helix transcriptional regulator [candidate division WOR-3 bacterium]
MRKRKMLETHYRASRFCRVLGNPTAYQILKSFVKSPRTPTELSKKLGLSLKTISSTLRNLRQINLVRYETQNKNKVYFLKDRQLPEVLRQIEKYVDRMRVQKW